MAEANRNATAAVVSGHLQPGHEPIFRVVARRGQAAIASTNTMTVTMNGSDESGWYRVTGLTYKGKGEAGWDDRGQTLKIRPEFLAPKADPEDPDQSIWVEASDWKTAVWTVVQGQLNVEATFDAGWISKGDIVTHNFPSGGDFVVGTEAEIRQIGLNSTRKASHFKDRPQNKVIAVEDTYAEWDRDYDDWWWEVEVEKAPSVTLLLGADDVSDDSTADDWVGAHGHKMLNWISLTDGSPAKDYTLDLKPTYEHAGRIGLEGGGTINVRTNNEGTADASFIISGGTASSSLGDVVVTVVYDGLVLAEDDLTVIKFNAEPETGGTSHVAVNPAHISSWAGGLFAFDLGIAGGTGPQQHNSDYVRGTVPALYPTDSGAKFGLDDIEVVWGREIGNGSAVASFVTSDDSPFLMVNPPSNGSRELVGGTHQAIPSNLRMRDVGFPAALNGSGATARYLIGHPTQSKLESLSLQGNAAAKLTARATEKLEFRVSLNRLNLRNPDGSLTTIGLSNADMDTIFDGVRTIWSQVGVTFTRDVNFHDVIVGDPDLFDPWNRDTLRLPPILTQTTDDVTKLNRTSAIGIYFVNTLDSGATNGETYFPGGLHVRVGGFEAAIIVQKAGRSVDALIRTTAHELGHYLMRSSVHSNDQWNIMIAGATPNAMYRDITDAQRTLIVTDGVRPGWEDF